MAGMTTRQLFALWPQRVAVAWRRWRLDQEILWTQRYLDAACEEIADAINAKRYLQIHLMQLKAERRSS
jgi:hypothetical protein